MNVIYSTSTSDFIPLSFEGNYLYENYSRVIAFLRSKATASELNRIAKPVVDLGKVDWYSNESGPMRPLLEFDALHQQDVEVLYVALLSKVKKEINSLRATRIDENRRWAELLEVVFNVENNYLISNGKEWAIIWGWKFHSYLRYATPDFDIIQSSESSIDIEDLKDLSTLSNEIISDSTSTSYPSDSARSRLDDIEAPVRPEMKEKGKRVDVGFWTYFKRILRWLAYRFWALLLLLFMLLLCCCLCRKCSTLGSEAILKEKLIEMEQKVDANCSTSDTLK